MRYKEDISWANNLDNVIIYNKGNAIKTSHETINLPNLGMYHASMLYHIVENYENLADITLFIQANPFDGDFEIKNNFKNNDEDVFKMINAYFDIPENELISNNNFSQYIGDKYNSPSNYNQRHHDCFLTYTHSWKDWINKFIDPKSKINWNQNVRFYRNGHMALRKEALVSNKIDYYKYMLQFWKYDVPVNEWFFESTSNFVFNVGNDGKYIDLGHNDLNFSNIEDYKTWMYRVK